MIECWSFQLDSSASGYVDWNEFCTYLLLLYRENDYMRTKREIPFLVEPKIRHIVQNRVCIQCILIIYWSLKALIWTSLEIVFSLTTNTFKIKMRKPPEYFIYTRTTNVLIISQVFFCTYQLAFKKSAQFNSTIACLAFVSLTQLNVKLVKIYNQQNCLKFWPWRRKKFRPNKC